MQCYGHYGYKEVQHPADIALDVWSDSIQGIFQAAFSGMVSLIGYTVEDGTDWFLQYRYGNGDLIDQLIGFLNEVVYLLEENIAVRSFDVDGNETNGYRFLLNCNTVKGPGLLIKAVTYGGAKLINIDGVYKARIVFDV